MIYRSDMKHYKLRIAVNAVLALLILASRLLIIKRRKIIYFNPETGQARYKTTYYILLFIPVFKVTKQIP